MKKFLTLICTLALSGLMLAAHGPQPLQSGHSWSAGVGIGSSTPLKGGGFFRNTRPALYLDLDKKLTKAFSLGTEATFSFNSPLLPGGYRPVHGMNDAYLGAYGSFDFMRLASGPHHIPGWGAGLKAGGGWGHLFGVSGPTPRNFFAMRAGAFVRYDFTPRFAVTLSPVLTWDISDARSSNSSASYNAWYARLNLLAGVKYSFGPALQPAPIYDMSQIDQLNLQVNSLRADLNDEREQLAAAKKRVGVLTAELAAERSHSPTVVKEVAVDNHLNTEFDLFFLRGSSVITPDQMPNLERMASMLKSRPAATLEIKGYASSDGNIAYNRRLAIQRAQAVKDALVGRFGIRPTRITANGEGVGHIFDDESWNRVCVCTIKD